jgi:hypothetical protein
MCERCLCLQASHDQARARLGAVLRRHGGSIPAGHTDMVFLRAEREIGEAHREARRRHLPCSVKPTCIICDVPAVFLDRKLGAMVCAEHLGPQS